MMEPKSGRDRRLLAEWRQLRSQTEGRQDIICTPTLFNSSAYPVQYEVEYRIRSICAVRGVESLGSGDCINPPVFADRFIMRISLPEEFPCVDAPAEFRFLVSDDKGYALPHPWHPNIRWFGSKAGHVCLNRNDSFTSLAWGVERVASYLRYELYHARNEPPYPEDRRVASWVICQGEPNEWIYF